MSERVSLSRQKIAIERALQLLRSQGARRFAFRETEFEFLCGDLAAAQKTVAFVEKNETKIRAAVANEGRES